MSHFLNALKVIGGIRSHLKVANTPVWWEMLRAAVLEEKATAVNADEPHLAA